jgi:hypothetical protein
MKVAIVGLSPSHEFAPWGDPAWEKWGLGWDTDWPRLDRVFEMHSHFADDGTDYVERLKCCPRLYMQAKYLPNATEYPLEAVGKTCGAYWESSIAYAMALAIHEGAEEIALFGIDMKSGEEHGYQKPNMEYLIGLAKGKGIKVHIPETSPLLKFSGEFGYAGRYGWRG